MLQKTLLRVGNCAAPILSANEKVRPLLQAQLDEIGVAPHQLILEPSGRNTAPALAAAALLNPDSILLVLPCDHAIGNPEILRDAIERYQHFVRQGAMIAFGVRPAYAESGFGYIGQGERIESGLYKIDSFIEKPAKPIARQLIKTGHYYWNSGIFLLSAATILAELEKYTPALLKTVKQAIGQGHSQGASITLGADFASILPVSIDVAVMERSDKILVVPLALDWHDLGTFPAFFRMAAEKLWAKTVGRLVLAPHHPLS